MGSVNMKNTRSPKSDSFVASGLSSSSTAVKASESVALNPLLHNNTERSNLPYETISSTINTNLISDIHTPPYEEFVPHCANTSYKYININDSESTSLQKTDNVSVEKLCNNSSDTIPLEFVFPSSFSFTNNTSVNENKYSKSTLEEKSFIGSSKNFVKQYQPNEKLYEQESESSNFICYKCGQGFPCTLFLCKRTKPFCNLNCQEFRSQFNSPSGNKENINSHVSTNSVSESENSNIGHLSDSTSLLEYDKAYNLYSYRKKVDNFINSLCLEELKKHLSSNKEPPKSNKMQCKDDLKELKNTDIKLPKNIKNLSVISDTSTFNPHTLQPDSVVRDNYNLLHLDNNDIFSVKNYPSINSVNCIGPQSSKTHLDSFSEGTRNFLNELAASNCANSFSDNVSGYALSTINSPLLSLKGKKLIEPISDDNHERASVSNDEDNIESKDVTIEIHNISEENRNVASALCCISDENKDVTSSLSDITDVTSALSNIRDENKNVSNAFPDINDVTSALSNISAVSKDVSSALSDINDVTSALSNISDVKKDVSRELSNMSDVNKDITTPFSNISDVNIDVTSTLDNISDGNKDITSALCVISDENKDATNTFCNITEENRNVTSTLCDITDENKDITSALCDITDENKDVTSALDLIEQSSLHDRNLSSAEICNSLNQIFSETTTDLSANVISNVESNQTDETQADLDTNSVTLCMNNNESEIYLQAVESGISFTADETGTINLSDYSSGNPEFWQRVLLVQDETGNIETVYLLQDDKFEGVSSTETNSIDVITPSENNIENLQTNQHVVVNNVLVDSMSDQVHSLLISQDTANCVENILITQDSVDKDKNEPQVENTPLQTNILLSQNDINLNQEILKIENISENLKKHVTTNNEVVLIEQESKGVININPSVLLTENNFDEGLNVTPKESSDKFDSVQNTVPVYPNKVVDSVEKEYVNKTKLNHVPSKISVHFKNSEISDSLTNFYQSSKAKKSISKCMSDQGKFVEDLIQFNQPLLNNCADPLGIYKTTFNHANGAIYHSESALASKNVQSYNSSNMATLKQLSDTEQINEKPLQKSKKSFPQKLMKRTAKKSLSGSSVNNCSSTYNDLYVSRTYDALNCSDYITAFSDILKGKTDYARSKNLIVKRMKEDEHIQEAKRLKRDHSKSMIYSDKDDFNIFKSKKNTVALKTFIKPFTAAKKSVLDPRDSVRNVRNTAMKTFVPKTHKAKSALKSFSWKQVSGDLSQSMATDSNLSRDSPETNVNIKQSYRHQPNPESTGFFQPEVCEIRILPNDYVQRASHILLNASSVGPTNNLEDNASDEEIKLPSGCSSPIKEILSFKFHCSCAAKEVPCICNDGNLQLTCEAEDSIDENIVACTNRVSQQCLLTPSNEIRHRTFCDIHVWRLRQHHCCPKCGVFCSQGEFLLCSHEEVEMKENHLFHTTCSIVPAPGLPPSCPHCSKFSSFNPVHLVYRSPACLDKKEVPSNVQNITSELNGCEVFLSIKPDTGQQDEHGSTIFVPEKKELQLMITSLANEKSLRLRPTGKCLYNPIKIGDTQKVMQLIANGVNPNHKFRMHSNNAPIHVAAFHGWIQILHTLLQAGSFIDSVNDDLETPLIVAVERNQLKIVHFLVYAGAQIDVKDCNGMTCFHIASKNGFKEIAEFLYSTGKIDINLQDDGGWTALVWACEHKHVDFVRWLLEIGADPNVRDNEENTVLHWAAYSGKCEIAELLLEKGCTLTYVNKRGDSALHIAAREDNFECVKLFINRGAVVDQKNKENKTPLMCCQDDSKSFNYLCQSISSGALKIGKMQLEKHVVFRDISRGAESYPIQAINEVDDEEFIMEFRYVIKNCHRSGVNIVSTVDSMQLCYCKDNCVTRDCNCTLNSKCWYDAKGCLTSEYNLQSVPAIFECNKTCHCPKTCINRVVQQGLRCPLQIFRTRFRGWGVRTLQVIPKGAFVCEYVGELITSGEAVLREDDTYLFDLASREADYCLDGRYYGNVARFLNHSCEPNLIAVKVFVDHQDLNFPRIAFFSIRRIQAFEELCFDYGLDFWIVKSKSILCTCNTQSCKYSKDTIDDTLTKFFNYTKCEEQLDSSS